MKDNPSWSFGKTMSLKSLKLLKLIIILWAEELLNDPDFLLAAIANNPWALALAPAGMQRDRDFLLKVRSTKDSFDEVCGIHDNR